MVYKLNCECGACYIGETQQYLSKRISSHKSNIKFKSIHSTALAKHVLEENHKIDFENPEILDTESNFNKRLISEMMYISKNSRAMNHKTDIQSLSLLYENLITQIP